MLYNSCAFSKESLDMYLKQLAKEFRKLNGKAMPAEIILIGGASILANYGFRDMTYDIDALIIASSAMKDAVDKVGDMFELPKGWLNSDFAKTSSYSPKLRQFSKYYRTFSNILTVRTVSAEHLIAMKLMSGRQYKHDMSDIVGIMLEHQKKGNPLSYEKIEKAVIDLYDSTDKIPEHSMQFIKRAAVENDLEKMLSECIGQEQLAKDALIEFEEQYDNVLNDGNINDILQSLLEIQEDEPEISDVDMTMF